MQKISDILKKNSIKPKKYVKKGKVLIIDDGVIKYVIKEKKELSKTFNYLKSRNFNYYPKVIYDDDNYEITEYIDNYDIPIEQKMYDMIDLVTLLHNKTTHYKEIDISDYKKIYEDITNNIIYLYGYYDDLMTIIESKVFMSPSEYLLARNINKVYQAINFSKEELNNWYETVKNKKKQRLVVLHNNLSLDHFLRNEKPYLISWDKSKIDIPVFDLYKLYKKHALDMDFIDIFNRYQKNYPLKEEEKKLFFTLIALPDLITFNKKEYEMTQIINKEIDYLYKTEQFILPNYAKNTKN